MLIFYSVRPLKGKYYEMFLFTIQISLKYGSRIYLFLYWMKICRIRYTSLQELSTDVYSRRILFFNHTHKMLKYYLSYLFIENRNCTFRSSFWIGLIGIREKKHLTLLSLKRRYRKILQSLSCELDPLPPPPP
jgi:hypothetical protein